MELVEEAIAQAEALDPQLNAIVETRYDDARREAAALNVGDQLLAGVPILLKDLACPVEEDTAYQGNRVLREVDYRYSATGSVARRLREAGTISIGRSHSPELGGGNCPASAETDLYGPTHNPWDPTRTAMGSSGGAAAAVAAGIVPIAQASDGGGSIRIPAAACGLVGLKPTRGRISSAPSGEMWAGGVTDGVVSRTVRDSALALDVLAGNEPGDPYLAPPFSERWVDQVGLEPGSLRVGLCLGVPFAETHLMCRQAVTAVGAVLEQLGHRVDEAHPEPLDRLDFMYDYIRIIRSSLAADLNDKASVIGRSWTPGDVEDGTWVNYQRGLRISAPDYAASRERLHVWTRQMVDWWERGNDILVTSTLATPPPELGHLVGGDDRERRDRLAATIPLTPQFNVTGQPAISLPLHWTSDGVPIGVQLVAATGREDLLFRLASQLETAMSWSDRVPVISST